MELVSKKDVYFLNLAMGVALGSKCKFRHGCLVVKNGNILGSSPNLWRNDPRYVNPEHCQIHAEIASMKKANWPMKATIYVARLGGSKSSEPRMSKPCANCMEVLRSYKAKVIWTQ